MKKHIGICRCPGYGGIPTRLLRPSPTRPRGREARCFGKGLPLLRDLSAEDEPAVGKGLARGHPTASALSSPKDLPFQRETRHVRVTHVKEPLLTKAIHPCHGTEEGHALLVYKAKPIAAPAKATLETVLFGERRPGRHNPTKETSPDAPPCCQDDDAVPSVDQDHEG